MNIMAKKLLSCVVLTVLFFLRVSAMDKQTDSEIASEQLYGVMIRAHNIVNKRSLLGNDGTFDPSESNLIMLVKPLLERQADPNYKLYFKVPICVNGITSVPLPTSMELAKKLAYKKIEHLMLIYSEKTKIL